jgi:hypothetical protein
MPQPRHIISYFNCPTYTETQKLAQSLYLHLAQGLEQDLEPGPEKATALRKLLESFDAAMRAAQPAPVDTMSMEGGTPGVVSKDNPYGR